MDNKEQKILKEIVELYIATAKPVGSKIIAEDRGFEASSATIRNIMLEMERRGYITQPHTSAGRIPTAKGYRFYLDNLLSVESLSSKEKNELGKAYRQDPRQLAKLLVQKTNLATIVGFAPNDLYFTGLFNLFSQPEFEDYKMVLSMSQVVDSLEKAIAEIYTSVTKPAILLGDQNPFSQYCSVAVTPLSHKELLAILGPMRMDYNKILSLLEGIVQVTK